MQGSIDKCLPIVVSGWAWNPNDPSARLTIQARHTDGSVFSQFRAAKYRPDLLAAGIGDGCHAFEFIPFGLGSEFSMATVEFVVVETGHKIPFSDDARTLPSRLPEPVYTLSERFHSPVENEPREMTLDKDILALSNAVDGLYKIIETQFPAAALRLNNTKERPLSFIPKVIDVLFLVGLKEGESKRYRIYNVVEALESAGYRCGIYFEEDIQRIVALRPRFLTCVIFRAPLTPIYQTLIEYAKTISAKTVWDVDDYVFDVSVIPQIDGLRYLTAQQKIKNAEGMRLYKKFISAVDVATTPTSFLCSKITETGQQAYLIPNTLDSDQLSFATTNRETNVRNPSVITIGFFSGTKTHDLDFREAKSALVRVLEKFGNVRFIVVGHYDIEHDSAFKAFGDRIEKIGFVPYLKMLDLLRYIDIIIIPLELIPYCQGKSELKFFEAALVGCVSVASNTDTYSRAIQNGETGFTCSTPDEWYSALSLLCSSPALRETMATAAYRVACSRYVMKTHINTIVEAYGLPRTLKRAENPSELGEAATSDRRTGRSLKTISDRIIPSQSKTRGAFLLPDMLIGGGGHRKAIMFASALEAAGIVIDLVFQNSTKTPDELADLINGFYTPFLGTIKLFAGSFTGYDWVVATSWSTAVTLIERGYDPSRVIYLVQDFEPLFFAMGSDFIRAEATYLAGFQVVAFGNWIGRHLQERYKVKAKILSFSLDRTVYKQADEHRQNRLLFFAKPEMARRCFELGSEALRIFHRLVPDTEICLYGSEHTANMDLGFEFTDLGVITDLNVLATLYNTSQLGIAVSTTNPSIVGYEMLACGCPVVDIDRPDLDANYENRDFGVIPVRPFARDFATKLAQTFGDLSVLRSHQLGAPGVVVNMPSDRMVCDEFVAHIVEFLDRVFPNPASPRWSAVDNRHSIRDEIGLSSSSESPKKSATRRKIAKSKS